MQIKDELVDILSRLEAKIEANSQAVVVQENNNNLPVPLLKSRKYMCKYPIDLCRISPFFPVNRRFIKERQYIRNVVIAKTAWGEIIYSGLILTTYEEDVLLALLSVMESNKVETEHDGKKTFRYVGPILPILKALGYRSSGQENYKHVMDSLRILSSVVIELKVKKSFYIAPLVFELKLDGETKELSVSLNPYFHEVFQLNAYTLIEMEKRMKIGVPIGKALYRFVSSQRDGWHGHYMTLAKVLNLGIQRPNFRIRDDIRTAIRILVSEKILSKRSCLDGEIVNLIPQNPSFPQKTPQNFP